MLRNYMYIFSLGAGGCSMAYFSVGSCTGNSFSCYVGLGVRLLTGLATRTGSSSRESFGRSDSGNFAVMTAIMLVPLIAGVGLAVDVSMAMNLKNQVQHAADAAALVLAREKNEISLDQAHEMAAAMLNGNFDGQYKGLKVSKAGAEWQVDLTLSSPNTFMKMFVGESTEIKIVSRAAHSTMSYEIALVLDTTGSMEGKKLKNLKEAATAMVETMSKDIDDEERVKFALVPFSTFVNVGPQFAPKVTAPGNGNGNGKLQKSGGASWLDLEGASTMDGVEIVPGLDRFSLFYHLGTSWEGCVETRQPTGSNDYDTRDLPASSSDPRSLFVPAFHIDDKDATPPSRSPNSYLNDDKGTIPGVPSGLTSKMTRYGVPVQNGKPMAYGNWVRPPMDTSKSNYYSNYDERKGPNFFCDSAPIVPLTTDYEGISSAIDDLTALGNTNIFEGLMWGWRVLSPGEPFLEGRTAEAFNNEKIIILLSDGNNAWNKISSELRSSYSSFGFLAYERLVARNSGDSAILAKMDAKTLTGCNNAKAEGITIYTIRLELDDKNSDGLLKACASSADHYFDVPDAKDLQATFEDIRDRINRIRLTL
ncbi:pilus assembly protein TadG-related protein [Pseudaminobacter sp. NGMCC 1.201702]|uniref:pilus assembly protein TadG-related protein n=1 Tax=Pseudaminobacter sp. NGMCC 1.201702 TaxID=3391825 RepID=UPI0039EDFAAD